MERGLSERREVPRGGSVPNGVRVLSEDRVDYPVVSGFDAPQLLNFRQKPFGINLNFMPTLLAWQRNPCIFDNANKTLMEKYGIKS